MADTKIGRNPPPHLQELFADLEQVVLSNPGLSREDLEAVVASRMQEQNSKPSAELCGLSPEQMLSWINAPWSAWEGVEFSTPADVSSSPVMRYLEILLEHLLAEGGSIRLTPKGNLPLRVVQQCGAIAEQLPSVGNLYPISISEYRGRNEEEFNALHYTRIVAELAGILYQRSGRLHFKKDAQKKYRQQAIGGFYADMLESATSRYNWAYLDLHDQVALQELWLFMLWRLQSHCSIEQLVQEVAVVLGPLLDQLPPHDYFSKQQQLHNVVSLRFVWRFLGFFGLVRHLEGRDSFREAPVKVEFTPLMEASFKFTF